MNHSEEKKTPGRKTEQWEQDSKDAFNVRDPSPYSNYVIALTAYYTILVFFSLWLLVDTLVGGRQLFLTSIGFADVRPNHIIRTIIFVATGALLGNVLYQIRQLYKAHCKPKIPEDSFNPRWLGKYLSAPWEAVGLALIVVALIGGNLPNETGPVNYPTSHLSTFAGFGLGGLLGFGIREVVGWLGDITAAMFPTKNKNPSVREDEKGDKNKQDT